jgi:hypothetical protein
LNRVTHITSVSGGSILAAHLALHWDRYTGSANDFDKLFLRRVDRGLDGVFISDVGKSIKVRHDGRAGGLIRTAMRASDILMDRVGQLEKEIFGETPGFIFVPITQVVTPDGDPTAPPPEVQRQTANIRTDLDRFTPLEISCLVRHGYCVGRQACRTRPDLFGDELPAAPLWDPVPGRRAPTTPGPSGPARPADGATAEARALRPSADRRIWSRLFDPRDWASYVYIPLIVPILVLLPYFLVKYCQWSHRVDQLVESLAQGAPELQEMTRLLEDGPDQPWTGVEAEEVARLDEPDFKGYEILQDSRVIDMRTWKRVGKGDLTSWVTSIRRLRVHKLPDHPPAGPFRVNLLTSSPRIEMVFPRQELEGRLRVSHDRAGGGQKHSHWEASFDFGRVPVGEEVDVVYKYQVVGSFQDEGEELRSLRFPIQAPTAELSLWILLPRGREHGEFGVIRFPTGTPEKVEGVKVATRYSAEDSSILSFKLLSLKPAYTYELRWGDKK